MRRLLLLLCVLTAVAVYVDRPRAAGPSVTFHAIGDLTGGGFTTVISDATRADDIIYAVGGAVSRRACNAPCPMPTDTPATFLANLRLRCV